MKSKLFFYSFMGFAVAVIALSVALAADVTGCMMAKVTTIVCDSNTGLPLADAKIEASYAIGWTGKDKIIEGHIDNKGIWIFEDQCLGDLFFSVFKEGYYRTGYTIRFKEINHALGRYEPWDQQIDLSLKKIGKQIPMYAKNADIRIPKIDKTIGYDLMAGDWVSPYGNGQASDFLFQLTNNSNASSMQNNNYYDISLTISFSNNADGIQTFLTNKDGSYLKLPRVAPPNNYKATLTKRIYVDGEGHGKTDYAENQNYIFRVRTKADKDGNIESALYGKIIGDVLFGVNQPIKFTYCLNPEPNSRNLEWDTNKNLISGLKRESYAWPVLKHQ